MAVQVSYPGVYIEEFAPGAPIQGVATSTAAFVGTAARGPIDEPTLIQSWDAFEREFGGIVADQPKSYLGHAVRGFFLNGGTACYVVRAATAVKASVVLSAVTPVLRAEAIEEGPIGNSITVQVTGSSVLAAALTAAGAPDSDLAVHSVAPEAIGAVSPNRRELTVGNSSGFAAGDRVLLAGTPPTLDLQAIVEAVPGANTVVVRVPLPAGTYATVRIADVAAGQRTLRLAVPADVRLNRALPRGATVSITRGADTEPAVIESSGGDTITLTQVLGNSYALDDPTNLPRVASLEFDLSVTNLLTGHVESFEHVAKHPNHPNYWGTSVESDLVSLSEGASTEARPPNGVYGLAGGQEDDRSFAASQIRSEPDRYLGYLKPRDEVSLVCIPGETDIAVQRAMITHCEDMGDRFAILDPDEAEGPNARTITDQFSDVRSDYGYAALYYPRIIGRNPVTGTDDTLPPSGHLAGVYARIDQQRGVHKAPANTNIRGALDLERLLTNDEQGPLNLMGINVLRMFPAEGLRVWGARTTTLDSNWQYVNVRRLFLFLEESIQEGINWAVFEPNNLQLWQKLRRSITEFLTRVWRDGALFGATAEEAFYVRIDEVLNPPSTQALGRLYIEIGVRPTYAAEFIIVRIGIWHGGSEVTEG